MLVQVLQLLVRGDGRGHSSTRKMVIHFTETLNFFPRKAGLSLHFTDSKSECPGYPQLGVGGVQMTGALHAVLFPREIQPYANCHLQVSF